MLSAEIEVIIQAYTFFENTSAQHKKHIWSIVVLIL